MDISVGDIISKRYSIKGFIGSGGFTEVYRAFDEQRYIQVALKFLKPEWTFDKKNISRFQREAKLLNTLAHPHIVRLFEFERSADSPYLVMDYVERDNLQQYLDKVTEPLPFSKIIQILKPISLALHYAHSNAIVHANVKPNNIAISVDDDVYLMDFSIAKAAGGFISHPFFKMGDQLYLSPEQIKGLAVTPSSDIFQIGLIAYQMLTGNIADFKQIFAQELPPVQQLNRQLNADVNNVLMKSLSENPDDRYEDAIVFIEALESSGEELIMDEAVRNLRVFLCHASEDKKSVRDVYRLLEESNVDPWLDEKDLLPGQDWKLEIREAVENADIILVFLSDTSVNKIGYVQKEIRYAIDAAYEQPEGSIFLIPVRLEECSLPSRLSDWQWVDLFEEHGTELLLASLEERASNLGLSHPYVRK